MRKRPHPKVRWLAKIKSILCIPGICAPFAASLGYRLFSQRHFRGRPMTSRRTYILLKLGGVDADGVTTDFNATPYEIVVLAMHQSGITGEEMCVFEDRSSEGVVKGLEAAPCVKGVIPAEGIEEGKAVHSELPAFSVDPVFGLETSFFDAADRLRSDPAQSSTTVMFP